MGLISICPELVDGLDFTITREGRIKGNVPLDIIHTFLDGSCPDRLFVRNGKFKDSIIKAVEKEDPTVIAEREHQHFCELMGVSQAVKQPARVVVIPSVVATPVEMQDVTADKIFPDLNKSVLIYIQIKDKLHSMAPTMYKYIEKDKSMLQIATELKHIPSCVFLTPLGYRSSEERRPVFHWDGKKLMLQPIDSPANKIRKTDSANVRIGVATGSDTPSTIYIHHAGILHSMKADQFVTVQNDHTALQGCKTLKHYPTCVYERNGILFSNDVKRPLYTIVDGNLVQTLETQTA